ncbi:hypothetical protein RIR_jg23673.t1 [Rhizophagus irregularis DAOM 181602=DAOM 197198]|uniref:Uncharacterized protein n=1 Tax=Rhizophagus irregularis (strain DAOM 181602 / DAOM 197198 / MUCL 43194) TaxID=747089 RepID=U9U5T1_RHIID|nr:hypothetical protein RIR_jg23673.t1 [Rhizophagus irregularis DAOM 181602=DAOM 197198]
MYSTWNFTLFYEQRIKFHFFFTFFRCCLSPSLPPSLPIITSSLPLYFLKKGVILFYPYYLYKLVVFEL